MSFYIFHSLNCYVLFHLKDNFLFHLFFSVKSRDIFVLKILIYIILTFFKSYSEKKISIFQQSFPWKHIFYESDTIKSTYLSPCILNVLWVIDLSLIFFNTSWEVYSLPKELKYIAVLLSINNETQCAPLLFYYRDLWHTLHLLF